ncbi:peptidase M48 [Wolbachia pipientis]|uniref:Peptidase M48 n=1 Tax=Wolbachia pipientis TaxID=955 RepID=A0A1E7QJ52_WOLPI|nr:M48 family metalloprotease [Wolbachia pipientis]OEY86407.1 peptidase M48 [Wolbachia pipientis]
MFKIASLLALLFFYIPSYATDIFRDSEVETIVKNLGQPLFDAAGVDSKQIKVFVVNDNSVNAFIIDNKNIFIHLGLLQYSTEPYVLLGVLAHEIAHIAAGHMLQNVHITGNLASVLLGSCLLGLIPGAIVDVEIASALVLGSVTVGINSLRSYSQEQEKMADSYALKYLDESGYDNVGVKALLNDFKSIEPKHTEQYIRTHPLSNQRLIIVQNYKVKNELKPIPVKELLRFKRMVIKLDSLFIPIDVLHDKYGWNDNDRAYVDAIVYYREGKIDKAIMQIDTLVTKDPHLYELKAEILYKAGRLSESIENYEKFLQHVSDESGLVRLGLSHTLLLHGNVKRAIFYLEQIIDIEPDDALAWGYLSIAYKHDSNMAMYYFALARKAFITNDSKQFVKYASLATNSLPEGSLHLLQIEDMKKSKKLKS